MNYYIIKIDPKQLYFEKIDCTDCIPNEKFFLDTLNCEKIVIDECTDPVKRHFGFNLVVFSDIDASFKLKPMNNLASMLVNAEFLNTAKHLRKYNTKLVFGDALLLIEVDAMYMAYGDRFFSKILEYLEELRDTIF